MEWRIYIVVRGIAEVAGIFATFEDAEEDAMWLKRHGYKTEIGYLGPKP